MTEYENVIQLRTQDLFPQSLGNIVIEALSSFPAELETGAILTIDLARSKIRILPIISNSR